MMFFGFTLLVVIATGVFAGAVASIAGFGKSKKQTNYKERQQDMCPCEQHLESCL